MILAALPGNHALAQVNIYFEIQNEQVVGTNYEFDVYMYADQTNTFHSRGHVYIIYNPAAFGTNVVLNGNCTYSHLNLLNGSAVLFGTPLGPKYSTINFVDNGPRIVLTWLSNFLSAPASAAAHNEVPLTPTPLYHVSIAIQNGAQPPNLALDLGLMDRQIFYFNNNVVASELQYSFGQLPAILNSFEAKAIGEKEALIHWTTTEEDNTASFVLEKKVGNGNFVAITRMEAQKNPGSNAYSYTDNTFMGEQNTYRLKAVNLNGDVAFSDEVVVNFRFAAADLIISYPNPTHGELHLQSTALLEENYYLELSDLSGNLLQRNPLGKGNLNMTLDLNSYPSGVYLMRIEGPNGLLSVKRIIKN